MSTTTLLLSERLKVETGEHHRRAEGKEIQRLLVSGKVTREQYAAWMSQMMHVHAALEGAVDLAAKDEPRVRVVAEGAKHSDHLRVDIGAMGVVASGMLPATRELIAAIQGAGVWGLVGMQYVLEGSMNGNKYIAMGVRRGLGLTPGVGDTYLDPYGDQQRAAWAAFKSGLDALGADEGQVDEAVEGARAMFDGIAGLSEELA